MRTLFEIISRTLIIIAVIIVYGERTNSPIVRIFVAILMIWAIVVPLIDLLKNKQHSRQKEKEAQR